ncbi:MAG: bacterio-opsin activator domain-containing protein, partial [Halohasta sp.]
GLNETVQEIAHHVIESRTQAEIERVVCDRFAAADVYTGAWVGRLDPTGATIRPSAAASRTAGAAADCEGCSIPVEADAPTIGGPVAAAIETGESQLVHTSPTDPIYQQWSRSTPIRHRPGIVVPIRYESHLYGVVVVYTDRDGFDPRERDTLGRLGRIVGHAINAIERKHALVGGRATEVVVESAALAEPFLAAADDESMTVTIDRVLMLQDDQSLVYYTVEGIDPGRFGAIVGRLGGGEVRLLDTDGPRSRLELSTGTETIHSLVARHGGRITEAGLREGSFEITIRIPSGTAVRPVLNAARRLYPDLRLVSRTTVTPSRPTASEAFASLADRLTDRQREALEVGYYAGFFEWPRETTGDELADLMGVTPATVHHHLRHGQQKLLAAFFESDRSLT